MKSPLLCVLLFLFSCSNTVDLTSIDPADLQPLLREGDLPSIYMWPTVCQVRGDMNTMLVGGRDLNTYPCHIDEALTYSKIDHANQICRRHFENRPGDDSGVDFSPIGNLPNLDPLPGGLRERILEGMKELAKNVSHSAIITVSKSNPRPIPKQGWKNLDKPVRRPDGTLIALSLEHFFRVDYTLKNAIHPNPRYPEYWSGHGSDKLKYYLPRGTQSAKLM